MVVVVDAANVVGSRPDGWWRDRAGAAARLLERLGNSVRTGALTAPVVVVLEGAARLGFPAGPTPSGLRVVHAIHDGDSTILEEVAALGESGASATVITADRVLRAQVQAAGGSVLGPSWLLDKLS